MESVFTITQSMSVKYVGTSRAILWDLTALFMRLVQGMLLVVTTYDCYMRYLPKIVNFKDCHPR